MTKKLSVAAAFALLALAAPIHAATLPLDASAGVSACGDGNGCGNIISHSGPPTQTAFYQSPYAFGGTALVSATSGLPSVVASATGLTAASGTESYSMMIAGPANLSNISVTGSGLVFTSIQNQPGIGDEDSALAEVGVVGNISGKALLDEVSCDFNACEQRGLLAPSPAHSFKDTMSLSSNTNYTVYLGAGVHSYDPHQAYGTVVTAIADPYFQIDPAFLTANPGYSLEFSAGIDNSPFVAAAPLPAALPLFGTALAGLGGAGWIRRKRGKVSRTARG